VQRIATTIAVTALFAAGAAAGAAEYRLEDYRSLGETVVRPTKLFVVAIADDRKVRNRFEDKFVTHLRGRGIGGVASHTLVPSLSEPGDRTQLLAALEQQGVDGVMTVRAVPLDAVTEAAWVATWTSWLDTDTTVRQLVEQTLPLPPKRAKRYGIEFTLWGGSPGRRLWVGRSGTCSRKDLEDGVGDLLQLAIAGLKESRWIP
jgi:hypothetical protein